MFALEVASLISHGYKYCLKLKSILRTVILLNISLKNMPVIFENSTYDNMALKRYFSNYDGYINGNESRK